MSEIEEESNRFPPGFRFTPTDDELIEYYLLPRLQGRPHVPTDAIIEDYVYRYHPDQLLLNGDYKNRDHGGCWYFLSSRLRKYENGDRPSRCTEDGRGRWKTSTGTNSGVTRGKIKYSYSVLNYFEGTNYKEEDKGEWLMREITIPEYENKLDGSSKRRKTLDEFVVCKIYLTKEGRKNKNKAAADDDEDEAGPSGTSEETCPAATSQPLPEETGHQKEAKPKISKRRKRERTVQVATPQQALPALPPGRCLGPQAGGQSQTPSICGGGMKARPGATGYHHHHGGTGRQMVYSTHASLPPRPPVAFTGHQAPAYWAAPVASPGCFGPTPMGRQLGPAGQSFTPPRPVTLPTNYPAMQAQPETEEMRERRVYQQHVNELAMHHHRMMMQQHHQQQQNGNTAYPAQQQRPMPFMQQQQQQQQTQNENVAHPAQQQRPMPSMQQQQQQQPPYFGPGFNRQHVRPMAPQFLPHSYHQRVEAGQQVQCSSAVADFGATTTTTAETEVGSVVGATKEGTHVVKNDEET
ncbi:uncharacterized protein [Lolium perenne]|uniref:uncharacterized protein n=1 Tax=Lolium perenne TaxID=4522 RepID=UPI0021F610A3|nr:NAC domain-containing protein JA2-like [Lolium perenne]